MSAMLHLHFWLRNTLHLIVLSPDKANPYGFSRLSGHKLPDGLSNWIKAFSISTSNKYSTLCHCKNPVCSLKLNVKKSLKIFYALTVGLSMFYVWQLPLFSISMKSQVTRLAWFLIKNQSDYVSIIAFPHCWDYRFMQPKLVALNSIYIITN